MKEQTNKPITKDSKFLLNYKEISMEREDEDGTLHPLTEFREVYASKTYKRTKKATIIYYDFNPNNICQICCEIDKVSYSRLSRKEQKAMDYGEIGLGAAVVGTMEYPFARVVAHRYIEDVGWH